MGYVPTPIPPLPVWNETARSQGYTIGHCCRLIHMRGWGDPTDDDFNDYGDDDFHNEPHHAHHNDSESESAEEEEAAEDEEKPQRHGL